MTETPTPVRVRVIGRGRAGGSFAGALAALGWPVDLVDSRDLAAVASAAAEAELVLICVSDGAVADVAAAIEPSSTCVVAHCAGSLGLDVLGPHPRRAAIHPLVSLPTPEIGADRLRGAWFAIAGDPVAARDLIASVVDALDGRSFEIADADRARYHAAACIAGNHVVALLGQVERVAASVGAPPEAYLDLVRGVVENVSALGAAAALTGPAARGDEATIARHLAALDPSERPVYEVLADQARRLAASAAVTTRED